MRLTKVLMLGLCMAGVFGVTACNSSEAPTAAATQPEPAVAADETVKPEASPPPTEISSASPVSAADPIRGKGGLEEKCHARVVKEVGAPVMGTNRIEESEAAIEIYVNVEGAQAPWKCHGYKNGAIDEVMFTGSEGAA